METASARRSMAGAGEAMARPLRKRVERYKMRMVAIGLDLMEEDRWKTSKLYYEEEVKSYWVLQNIKKALRFYTNSSLVLQTPHVTQPDFPSPAMAKTHNFILCCQCHHRHDAELGWKTVIEIVVLG